MFLSPERPRRWSGVLIRAKQPFSNLAAHCNRLESIKKKKKMLMPQLHPAETQT